MTRSPGSRTPAGRTARRPNPAILAMSEDDLLESIKPLAALTGWRFYHTHNSQHSPAGFPDVVLLSRRQERLLFVELKRESGRVTTQQEFWIGDLRALGHEAAVWRPRHWFDDSIRRALQGERLPTAAPLHLEIS